MWYIHIIEYYLAIKKNEIMPFAATWMDLEIIILSEVSQTEKTNIIWYHMWNLKYDTNESFSFVLSTKQKDRHREQKCGCQGGGWVGEGWIGSLRLADANYYIENG